MRGGIASGVVVAALIGVACGSFRSSPETAASDAGPTTPAIIMSDAGDAAAVVAVDVGDASADCPAGSFCDDFERADAHGSWDQLDDSSDGRLTIDDQIAHTGTHALHASLLGTSSVSGAELRETSSLSSTKVSASLWLRATSARREINVLELYLTGTSGAASASDLVIGIENDFLTVGRQLDGDGSTYDNLLSTNIPVPSDTWVEIDIDIDIEPSPPVASVTLAGTPVPLAGNGVMKPIESPKTATLGVGIDFAFAGPTMDVWYDSLTFTP